MLLLPGFAALEARWGGWALVPSVVVYLAAYLFGLSPPGLGGTGIGFNPFAWQLLYLTGAWLGRRSLLRGGAAPARDIWTASATAAALAIIAAGLFLRLAWYGFLPIAAPVGETHWIVGKESVALPRILHAFALAWLVARFVPRHADWMDRAVPRAMAAVGRHSLDVFCLGLFLSWGAATAFRLLPPFAGLDPLLIGGGCLVLAFFAQWLDRRRDASRIVAPA
jgi:hypothetical protein